jgi:hypothetical protein
LGLGTEGIVSDQIIDINQYLNHSHGETEGAFSVWGGEGDRARLALPVWRAIALVGGDRGGLVRVLEKGGGDPDPFFVLDLGKDPARSEFPSPPTAILHSPEAPAMARLPGGGMAIFLGEESSERWFLMVMGGEGGGILSGRTREDLLFLAGECAGLLFFRGFAEVP